MARTATSKKSIYSVHPGVLMTQKWIGELKQKTGRTLEEWLAHIKKAAPKGEQERRAWLKEKYGLGTNTAWWLAERAAVSAHEHACQRAIGERQAKPAQLIGRVVRTPGKIPEHGF